MNEILNIQEELNIFKQIDFSELIEKTKGVELHPIIALIFLQLVKDKIAPQEINHFIKITTVYDDSMDDGFCLSSTDDISVDFTQTMMNILNSHPQLKTITKDKTNYNFPVYGVAKLELKNLISSNKEEHIHFLHKLDKYTDLETVILPCVYNILSSIKEKDILEKKLVFNDDKHKSLKI